MKIRWIVLIYFVATTIIVGVGTYYCLWTQSNNDKRILQMQIEELNNKIRQNAQMSQIESKPLTIYELNGKIWADDIFAGTKSEIATGTDPLLSPDTTIIAYSRYLSDVSGGIYLYDFISGKESLLREYTDMPNANPEKWSPDSQHLVIDMGTGIQRGKEIINIKNGKLAASFGSFGQSSYGWVDNANLAYTDISYNLLPCNAELCGFGLSLLTLDGESVKLKTPDSLTDYHFINTRGSKIYFYKSITNRPNDFSDYAKVEKSYWMIDPNGQNERQIDEIETKF